MPLHLIKLAVGCDSAWIDIHDRASKPGPAHVVYEPGGVWLLCAEQDEMTRKLTGAAVGQVVEQEKIVVLVRRKHDLQKVDRWWRWNLVQKKPRIATGLVKSGDHKLADFADEKV